jgi:hypothetical protein
VGYVEDEESVEAIMKKFEELERFQQELQAQNMERPIENHDNPNPNTQMDSIKLLNERQLEELFKRTSGYTVKEAMMDNFDIWEQQEWIDENDNEEE